MRDSADAAAPVLFRSVTTLVVDAAIAPDKDPLLPGGTAGDANYTSYSRGINGIMVDIANLPATALSNGDFEFRVGNDNNVVAWALAPNAASITVREGAGVNGSDRVTLVWANSAIERRWLQVRVKNNANTGLAAADVFYFGNAIGDTINSTGTADFSVNSIDLQRVRNAQFQPAPITSPFDHNRSGGNVNSTDLQLVRNNQFLLVRRITVPAALVASAGGGGAAVPAAPVVFASIKGAWADIEEGSAGDGR